MKERKTAYLSLGSNLGNKLKNLQLALFAIGKKTGDIAKVSGVYWSPSWGFSSNDFFNICIELHTGLGPNELLGELLRIEMDLGRKRNQEEGYSARTLDIDIIYYEKDIIDSDSLEIPHPSMQLRKFVLKPLADIAPQFYHPILAKDTRNLLQECRDKSRLTKIEKRLFANRQGLFSDLNFIAIEGNIGAGKTTLSKKIANDFNAKLVLERFADNPFLPKFYEDKSRYAFPLEMSFLADRYQQFSDDTSQFDLFKNFMVSDYDIFKSLIFAKVTLQEDEFKLYRKLFDLMYKEVKKPKMYIYLYRTTDRLLENIKKRGRDYEQNIDPEYLERINNGYLDFIKSYPEQHTMIIDLNDLDFVKKEEDYHFILDEIQNFALEILL